MARYRENSVAVAGMGLKVGVVTPYPLTRHGLIQMLAKDNAKLLVQEFSVMEGLVNYCDIAYFDIVIIDTNVKDFIRVNASVKNLACKCKVILLASWIDDTLVKQAKDSGVSGVIPLKTPSNDISVAINQIARGKSSWASVQNIEEKIMRSNLPVGLGLTEAQERVVKLVSKGFVNNQIAEELDISVSTVKCHMTNAFRNVNVKTRTELAMKWLKYEQEKYAYMESKICLNLFGV